MLNEIQQIVTIGATVGGLLLAANGINTWKREVVGKRDMEVCQRLIETFYEAQEKMRQLRNPFASNSESEERRRDQDESEDRARYLDTTYVPVARWNLQTEFWTAFDAQRWRAKAILGDAVLEPYAIMDKAIHTFRVAATARYRSAYQNSPLPPHLNERYDNAVWEGGHDPDEIGTSIQTAIAQIEAICIPKIRPPTISDTLFGSLRRTKKTKSREISAAK